MQDFEQIFHLIDVYYSGNAVPSEVTNYINSFTTNIDNLEICKNILNLEQPPVNCQIFASDAFRHIILYFISYFEFEEDAEPIIDWIIDFLIKSDTELVGTVLRDLGASLSIIFARFYDSKKEAIESKIGKLSVFFNISSDPSTLIYGIEIHLEIIAAFQNVNNLKTFKSFQKSSLYAFYATAKESLMRTSDEQDPIFSLEEKKVKELIGLLCSNLSKCIAFKRDKDKTVTISDEDLRTDLSDKELPIFFFQLFDRFLEPKVLDVIASYLLVSFAQTENYYEIIDNICIGLSNILQNQIEFKNIEVIYFLSIILSNLSNKITLNMIRNIDSLKTLIEDIAQFTIMSLQEFADDSDNIENILSFWTNLEKQSQCEEVPEVNELISVMVFDIYEPYINFLLEQTAQPENKIFNFQILNESLSSSITPIQSFLSLNPSQIYENLMEIYNAKKAEFVQILSNGYELNNVDKQIALFIQIFIKILQSISFNEKESDKNQICIQSFIEVFSLMEMTLDLLSQKVLFPEIEMSFSIFIGEFPSLSFARSSTKIEIQQAFYHEVSSSISISDQQTCQDIFFRRIITAVNSFYESECEKIVTINMLNNLAQKVTPSDDNVQELLQENFDESFDFMKNTCYRTLFISSLMSIIVKLNNCSILYDGLISRFNDKFEDISNQESILTLATDIRGLFRANIMGKSLDLSYYHIRFNSFFPDKMKLFADSLSSLISSTGQDSDSINENLDIINLSLKMCKWIVSRPSSKRIEFDKSSANGIILFTFSAQLIEIFLSFMESNLSNEEFAKNFEKNKYREFKCCCKILSNLLSGQYVPFEAFLIYEDTVFINVLNGFVQLISAFDIDSISTFPDTFLSLITFFKELCENQLKILIDQSPPAFLSQIMSVIFEYSTKAFFMNNMSTNKGVLTITSILQFIYEEQLTKEANALMEALNSDDLIKANRSLWQLLVSSNDNSEQNCVSSAIKYFILINNDSFDEISDKISEIAETHSDQDLKEKLDNFINELPEALESNDSKMIVNLSTLKKAINQKVIEISFE